MRALPAFSLASAAVRDATVPRVIAVLASAVRRRDPGVVSMRSPHALSVVPRIPVAIAPLPNWDECSGVIEPVNGLAFV